MMRSLLTLLALLVAAPAAAQISVVQVKAGFGNDVEIVMDAPVGASNQLIVVGTCDGCEPSQTITITNWATGGGTQLSGGYFDSPGDNMRGFAWCLTGDGADDRFNATSSGSGAPTLIAIEISGGASCASILRDAQFNDTAITTGHALGTDLTPQPGDLVIGFVAVFAGAADFTSGMGYTSVPAASADINGIALGQYKLTAASSDDPAFTSAVNESCFIFGLALAPEPTSSGVRRRLGTLGVGR